MRAFRKWSLQVLLIAVFFAGISALPAHANNVPPSPFNSFYGDSSGDTIIDSADLSQMKAWTLSLPYAYDTIQPQTSTQDWNTSDVTSDNLIDAADLSALKSWTLGLTVTIDDKPWALSNENLPASIVENTPTSFQINLASTIGTQFGRAGLPVIANIDAVNSTATGSLGGRTCTPVGGSRDQPTSLGDQCALSVTVTDWYGASGPTKGLTENGTYGLSVTGTTTGTLRIIFSISGNPPGLDIPAITAAFVVAVSAYNPPPTWITPPEDITGLMLNTWYGQRVNGITTDFNPGQTLACSLGYTNCTFPIFVSGSGPPPVSCLISIQTDMTEQTCNARMVVTDDGIPAATLGSTISITAMNLPPNFTRTGGTTARQGVVYNYATALTDADPGETLKCVIGVGDTCGGTLPADTPGPKPHTCTTYSFTPGAGMQSCVVSLRGVDNGIPAASATQNTTVTINRNPTWSTQPVNISIATGSVYNSNNGIMSDLDAPAQNLTCSTSATNCGFSISYSAGGTSPRSCGITFTAPATDGSCTLTLRATDNGSPAANQASNQITITWIQVNVPPVITSTAGTMAYRGQAYTYNITATDANPGQIITMTKSGADTCGGVLSGTCSKVTPLSGCTYTFTPGGSVQTCVVGITATDNGTPVLNSTQNTTVTVTGYWTWMSGTYTTEEYGIYGVKGVTDPDNVPGARNGAISWKDAYGKFWLFGGYGRAAGGLLGYLNDLWKWDGTNWTWVSGNNTPDQYGVYGTKGVTDPANVPGARAEALSWTDATGNFWLFGGNGHAASGSYGFLNDLWKWDGANWTWISGSNTLNQYGVYGTKGVPDPANHPGARVDSVSWTDASGNLWLFGGNGYAASGSYYVLNDLWRWDGTNWTWISGSNAINQYGVYGTKGVPDSANVPGSRRVAVSWKDASGNFWLFGGYGNVASCCGGYLNDLWKWDGTYWTWISGSNTANQNGVYGTKGVSASSNIPGARCCAVTGTDTSGNVWVFGGGGFAASGVSGQLNDLWKWDGTNWTWMSGSNVVNQYSVYGTKGLPNPANIPGSRNFAVSWSDGTGNLWLFGGGGYAVSGGARILNDLWRWDGTNWTWMSGSDIVTQHGTYGTKGVAGASNIPGGRKRAISWSDDADYLWLFGGYGFASTTTEGFLNDLWAWDGMNWAWISGSKTPNQNGVYGTIGVPDAANIPGARESAVSWKDATGDFWLFGGEGYPASGVLGYLNDLWIWDGADWTWISGSDTINQNGVYGTKGVPNAANFPGARTGAVSWTDDTGNLWLFGGVGYPVSGASGNLNDLWKWDGLDWTWISGSNAANQNGVYGIKGAPDPANFPGARVGAVSWTDATGNLWLFGGEGYPVSGSAGRLNDLWKWDGAEWTWISGSNTVNQNSVYGVLGSPNPANIPGSRKYSISWTDATGNLLLFGGDGYDNFGGVGYLNDLWKWDGANWTWISGWIFINQRGHYGTKGVPALGNEPGCRYGAIPWIDNSGDLWLFGGYGFPYSPEGAGYLRDLWRFDL